MNTLEKRINFGKVDYDQTGNKVNTVTIDIELKNYPEKPVFSASGGFWDSRQYDYIACGQCLDEIANYTTSPLFLEIYDLWNKYHLNDTNAGTPEQSKALDDYFSRNSKKYDYSEACEYLKAIGLYEVKIDEKLYKYGHAWLYRSIPEVDLKRILALFD